MCGTKVDEGDGLGNEVRDRPQECQSLEGSERGNGLGNKAETGNPFTALGGAGKRTAGVRWTGEAVPEFEGFEELLVKVGKAEAEVGDVVGVSVGPFNAATLFLASGVNDKNGLVSGVAQR